MATMISKGPRVGQKPTDLLARMQSRTTIDVARTLFSNSLILDGPELQDWQVVLQLLQMELASDPPQFPPDDGGIGGQDRAPLFAMPEEPPIGGGSHYPVWSEDTVGGGERWLSFPEERDGKGGKYRLPHMHTNVMQGAKPSDGCKAWNEFAAARSKVRCCDDDTQPIGQFLPEEPAGRGGHMLTCLPTEPAAMGEDEPSFDVEDIDDEVGSFLPVFPQEPIEDEAVPVHMTLVWTFDGTSPFGVQCLVEVPSFPPEDLGGGTEVPAYYCLGGDGYRPGPDAPGGGGGDRVPTRGQDDGGEELAVLLRAFEAVPSYVGRFADGREVW